jgi:hypothetical protein
LQDRRETARWSASAWPVGRPARQSKPQRGRVSTMSHVTYTVVEHDGGWAYKAGDVFSETFRTREAAHAAAERAAQEQRVPGQSGAI